MNWLRGIIPHIERNSGKRLVRTTDLRIPDQTERLRAIVRHELMRTTTNPTAETFDEADDFGLPDGDEWVSPYEESFEPELPGEGRSPSDNAPPAPGKVTDQDNSPAGENKQPPAPPSC